jgi:hypothetical protein
MGSRTEQEGYYLQTYPFPTDIDIATRRIREAHRFLEYPEEYIGMMGMDNGQIINTAIFVSMLLGIDESMECDLNLGLVTSYFIAVDQVSSKHQSIPKINRAIAGGYIQRLVQLYNDGALRDYFQLRSSQISDGDRYGWQAIETIRDSRLSSDCFDIGAVIFYDLMDEWRNDGGVDMEVWGELIDQVVPDKF